MAAAIAGPKDLAKFKLEPVKGPPIHISAAPIIPIMKPAQPGGALLSTATPMITNTNHIVKRASIATAAPSLTPWPGNIAPIYCFICFWIHEYKVKIKIEVKIFLMHQRYVYTASIPAVNGTSLAMPVLYQHHLHLPLKNVWLVPQALLIGGGAIGLSGCSATI